MVNEDVEKLKRNNQELQEIINNSWDGIGIIDKNTNFIYINNAFMPMLGFSKDEILKNSFTSFMEEKYKYSFLKLLKVEDKTKKYKAEIDIACIRKDKMKIYLKITISTMLNKNLFVINAKDITHQIADDEILDDYVISMHMDLHGHITKVSTAFLNLTKYEKKDIIGKHYSTLAHKDTDTIIYQNINNSLSNFQEWSGKLKNIKKDGNAFWVSMKIKPIYNKYGDVIGYTSLMFDITNEITLNDETSTLQSQVKIAKDAIKEKDSLLIQHSKLAIMTETLKTLSHEWRQPLNIISIQAQKLELEYNINGCVKEENAINILQNIKQNADNLSSTINELQNFLSPKLILEDIQLDKFIDELALIFKKELPKNIKLNIKINNKIDFSSYKNELKTVLLNILINAKEAILRKSILKGIIDITSYVENENLFFEIRDNGGGIEDETLPKIFEPYFSTKEIKHGVGLSLYTSKIITNIHLHGLISATNYDNGALFKISIPIN